MSDRLTKMKGRDKTKEQLTNELAELRQQIAELETSGVKLKRIEKALLASAQQWQRTFDAVGDVVCLQGVEGRILRCNTAMANLLGKSFDEIKGRTCWELMHGTSEPIEGCPIVRMRESHHRETLILSRGDRWLEDSVDPLLDENDNLIGAVHIISDVTERKQAEEALRESQERYRALVNLGGAVGEAIVMLQDTEQGDAIQTFVNREWPRITGYSRKELLGMSFFDLLHPRYRQASLKRHKRKVSGEAIPKLFEMSIIRKDGTEVPIEATSAYSTYKGKRANVAFIRDITERKQAEERERRLQQELYLSSRLASIGELAAGVAHQINNPLTGILGFSERLLRKSTDKEATRDLERIHNEAARTAKIVQNLLTFARRHKPKKECVNVNDILQKTLELRAYELKTSNIEVALDLAPSLPCITGDFQQIEEVFLNLILNAEQTMIETHHRGKLTIKTQQTKDYIRISFADDGPGIPAEHLDRLFDPFFTTREDKGGTGLGLSVCHGIVTEHEGKIYAQSKSGKGAIFFVELLVTTAKTDEGK